MSARIWKYRRRKAALVRMDGRLMNLVGLTSGVLKNNWQPRSVYDKGAEIATPGEIQDLMQALWDKWKPQFVPAPDGPADPRGPNPLLPIE